MKFRVGIENNNDGIRSIAWMLEHPGCYAYGRDQQEAFANSEKAILNYAEWLERHEPSWISLLQGKIEPVLEQVWDDYKVDKDFERVDEGGYAVESFFDFDWKPLTEIDIERAMKLLEWSHNDLVSILEKLSPEQWKYQANDERWDIAGLVNHIGGAEWWYLDQLGFAFPRTEVPDDPMERIEKARELMNKVLPTLKDVNKVVGWEGELWSPRKVLRRALWHERDHTEHIQKVLTKWEQEQQ